ncbi:MAG: bifunctional diaminohydroxyphosphoribosylaminopyrimidine deaminase/5-amino-6-(5-phosphoribosylamino)uracil reductase RibD [Armatimonadetes bacterium]|nr:bifunctional diaminohydroxyphosphoribosylaminopyrimidine deaminase/5-amino-6-(5-phosphoribosylamino)uracil reductase RibD [Armatimonadota bacterium]
MTLSKIDELALRRCLSLAKRGFPAPNPHVGAVVVKGGAIVGEGFHNAAGQAHAESIALAKAGKRAKGAELYCTLEPCSHHGKTPPCTDAIIAAGVSTVTILNLDPNPKVAGLDRLKEAGLTVRVLDATDFALSAMRINEKFFWFHQTKRPFVTIKLAISLDGRIAAASGDSQWISSEPSRKAAHKLRALHGAVAVGSGTAGKDDPQLTVRHLRVVNQPLRVLFDSAGRTPEQSHLFDTALAPTILYCQSIPKLKRASLADRGVEIVEQGGKGPVDLKGALEDLGRRGVTGLLVEGGARLAARLFDQRLANKLILFVAPILVGGQESFFRSKGVQSIADAPKLNNVSWRRSGPDFQFEGYLSVLGEPKE